MQKEMLDTILSEFKKLNERLNNMEKENENKFALIDARFNTLEGIVLSMQNDLSELNDKMNKFDVKLSELADRMNQFDIKLSELTNRMTEFDVKLSELTNRMTEFDVKLSELTGRMTEFDVKLSELTGKMTEFEERLSSIEKITLRMEYTFNDKISALFDAHTYQDDRYRNLDNRIRKIEIKVEKLSVSNC